MSYVTKDRLSQMRGTAEIDLVELIHELWAQRLLIGMITLVVFLVALAYAFMATPVYQARVSLLPPLPGDIAGYNLGRSEVKLQVVTVEDVYQVFTRNLMSESVRREFFKEIYLPSLSERERNSDQGLLWKRFSEALSVKAPDKTRPMYIEVIVEADESRKAAEWANVFVKSVDEHARKDMQKSVSTEIKTCIKAIERQIEVLVQSAAHRRKDRIVQLHEALKVARAVGQERPLITSVMSTSEGEVSSVEGSLLYMHGTRALSAELSVLEERNSDDPFIKQLPDLQDKIAFLEKLEVKADSLAVFTLDSPATQVEAPIKPNKAVILALGIILGLMLGVMIGIFRFVIAKRPA